MIRRIYRILLRINTSQLFVLFFVLTLLISTLINLLFYIFLNHSSPNLQDVKLINNTSLSFFFEALILAPILETALFQVAVITFCRVYIKNNLFCIIFPAIVFGVVHLDGSRKVISMIFFGLLLGFFYTISKKKKLNAFWVTALLHATWNLFVLIVKYIDN